MRRPVRSSSIWLRLSVLATILLLAYVLTSRRAVLQLRIDVPPSIFTSSKSCIESLSGEKVVFIVKTGASEAATKVPAQMETTLRCAAHVLHFSDLEQDLGPYHLQDALDSVSPSVMAQNPDFNFYREQKALWQTQKNISALQGARNPNFPDQLAAWTLDKYKFLHALEKAWKLKPDMDWYVLIDADTYVFYSNLLVWLATQDPNSKSYFGSEVNILGQRFAHGGSGIVMSRAAVFELVGERASMAVRWDERIRERCCGDLVLGLALKEHGIELLDTWPLMSGETPASLPFGPGTPEYMCKPALTMHHLSPADMRELAGFEQRNVRGSSPLTHRELFANFVMPALRAYRRDWDNLASDPGEFGKTGGVFVEAVSFEKCAQACEDDVKCLQYSHHGNRCHIGMSIRLGHKKVDEEGIWQSGWNKTRLDNWISIQGHCS
ncbi:glycosyltransferase family 31 protein [Hyaloscypha variabilis]